MRIKRSKYADVAQRQQQLVVLYCWLLKNTGRHNLFLPDIHNEYVHYCRYAAGDIEYAVGSTQFAFYLKCLGARTRHMTNMQFWETPDVAEPAELQKLIVLETDRLLLCPGIKSETWARMAAAEALAAEVKK
jgi:hypothetical protein